MVSAQGEAKLTGAASGPLSAANFRQCGRCSPGVFRRVNRVTLLERTLFTWLGIFPWECVSCRRKRYFRDPGRGGRQPLSNR